MYIPLSKYTEPKYTRGLELLKPDGTYYVGWYFTDLKGNIFTGKKPSKNNRKLAQGNIEITSSRAKFTFTKDSIRPTERDYKNGFFIRYFLQDKRSKKIIEVKKEKFNELRKIDYIISLQLEWLLTNPIENIKKGPYIYFGSLARNKGLDAVSCQNINSYVMFLDVGDELKPDAINMIRNQKEVSSDNLIFICKSCINFNRKSKPINIPLYPLWLRYVVNPFLIGGIIVSVKLAKKEYFYDGKKEDWIYWISLLNLKPQLVYIDSINFIYNIFNISDHYDKKWRSFIELRTIFLSRDFSSSAIGDQ